MLVCIDAGHAKATAGKRSIDGLFREYEFNRDVAKRLQALLERNGVKTMFSCDLGVEHDTPLTTRCATANKAKADLFVSIHANAYGTTWNNANGWEIFYSEGSSKGKKLADSIHKHSASLGLTDRGVKTSNFTVLEETKMPAVLIEHGFYTNRMEVAKLQDDSFREQCAIADAKGILEYLGIKWKEVDDMTKDEIRALIDEVIAERMFNQSPEVSDWAQKAWEEAKQKGITDGTSPKAMVTREQCVTMIRRAME